MGYFRKNNQRSELYKVYRVVFIIIATVICVTRILSTQLHSRRFLHSHSFAYKSTRLERFLTHVDTNFFLVSKLRSISVRVTSKATRRTTFVLFPATKLAKNFQNSGKKKTEQSVLPCQNGDSATTYHCTYIRQSQRCPRFSKDTLHCNSARDESSVKLG